LQFVVQPDGPTVTDVVFELIVGMPAADALAVLVTIPPGAPGAAVTRNPTVAVPPGPIVPMLKVSVPL
jgi:hypothetical protein